MHVWRVRERVLEIGRRPLVVGILNVTPDSFSDGGAFCKHDAAVEHGLKLIDEGADLLDVGGESTRPDASPVTESDELSRVVPVIEALSKASEVLLSVDTMKPAIAVACLKAGAAIINDVSGFRDERMIHAAVHHGAGAIVMHMQGTPATMQKNPQYGGVVREVGEFFAERIATLTAAGFPEESICLDPGIGFGKSLEHNLELLGGLGSFRRFGRPVCLGVSRKGFIGTICKRDVDHRQAGSLAVACFAADRGEAQLLRVHDVAATRDAMLLLEQISRFSLKSELPSL